MDQWLVLQASDSLAGNLRFSHKHLSLKGTGPLESHCQSEQTVWYQRATVNAASDMARFTVSSFLTSVPYPNKLYNIPFQISVPFSLGQGMEILPNYKMKSGTNTNQLPIISDETQEWNQHVHFLEISADVIWNVFEFPDDLVSGLSHVYGK